VFGLAKLQLDVGFYTCDAVFVCYTSICHKSIKADEWIQLVFGIQATFDLSYIVLQRNLVSPKIRVHPSRTLSQILKLENFTTARRPSQVLS